MRVGGLVSNGLLEALQSRATKRSMQVVYMFYVFFTKEKY